MSGNKIRDGIQTEVYGMCHIHSARCLGLDRSLLGWALAHL